MSSLTKTDYVLAQALEPLVEMGDERGWEQSELIEGLEFTEAELRNPRTKLSWDFFVQYGERVETKLGGPGEVHQMADALLKTHGPLAKFLGFFASPEMLYRAFNRWAGPTMVPPVIVDSRKLDQRRLEIEFTIPDHLRPAPAFFRGSQVMLEIVPCLLGGEPTLVESTHDGRHGRYLIHLPPSSTIWARVKRAFRAFFSGAEVLDHLVQQHERLIESHRDLGATHSNLERSEQNFRSLIEQTPLGIFVVADDVVLYANPGARAFLRVPEAEPVRTRRFSSFVQRVPAEDGIETVASDESITFLTEDGETVVGEMLRIDVVWDNREAELIVVTDVTEQERVMNQALQHDRMIAIGTLAAGVAHEINNPLAYVHSNLEYVIEALRQLEQGTEEISGRRLGELREALEESLEGTNRTRRIVRDMKSFTREPGELRVAVDLRDVVRTAINMSWHEVRTRAKLRTEYDDVPDVLADAGRLGQVVLNLVINAAQALEEEDKDDNFITIRTRSEGERGVIEVEDNGPGIAPANLRRIFDPFFTTKPVGEGTGLGLWISSNIVARLGGELTVESEPGRGTIFRVRVPFALAEDAEGPPELDVVSEPEDDTEETDPRPGREPMMTPGYLWRGDVRVMVVDDEELIVRLVDRVLQADVVGFTDPIEAVEHLSEDSDFDVILCDATMPGIDGQEFLNLLRTDYPELAERFVLLSGGVRPGWKNLDEIPEMLTKPFDIARLRRIVARISAQSWKPPAIH